MTQDTLGCTICSIRCYQWTINIIENDNRAFDMGKRRKIDKRR